MLTSGIRIPAHLPDALHWPTDQKVIRKACDNFLHYELNLNRALARET
jgi:hypothetical protein